jgi:transposase-like protein
VPRELTAEEEARAVAAARSGLSLTGVANTVRMGRTTYYHYRQAHPEHNADIFAAMADYEAELVAELAEYRAARDIQSAAIVQKILATRFPERHGSDPRMRAPDPHPDDEEKQKASHSRLEDAINALLDAREGPKDET